MWLGMWSPCHYSTHDIKRPDLQAAFFLLTSHSFISLQVFPEPDTVEPVQGVAGLTAGYQYR